MYCDHCGKQIDPNSQFCAHCGIKVDHVAESRSLDLRIPEHTERKPTKKLQTILVFSIPAVLIVLVVVWFLSGILGARREGFEKFLPDNTSYYVEVHDPIGLITDFEQSAFFKRLTASPDWKEGGISNVELRTFKDVLARLAGVRNAVGPVGIASIPSFSETGVLVFVRIERDYIGATRVNLEQFLVSQNVKYRKHQQAGSIRYDLETPPNSSFLLMDSGIVAADSPAILDKYIDWLETSGKNSLGNSDNYKKINSRKWGANGRGRIYFDSSTFLNSLTKAAGPSVLSGLTNVPAWVAKADVSFSDGIYLSSSFFFSQQQSLSKTLLQAIQKPISNGSLKYLPKDVVAFTTANLAAVWEFAKEEIRRQGAGGKEVEVEKLFQTLSGEALFAFVPDNQQQFSWGGGIVIGAEQKTPPGFITALEELLPDIKSIRQTERYGTYEITCYQGFFGIGLCLVNVDNFLFASLNKQGIYKILDVKDGKASGFRQIISSDAKLNRLFAGNRHGVTYVNLKDVTRNIPPTLWGNPQELAIKEKIANAPSPFYLAGATDASGDVFNGEAILVFDVPTFEGLFTSLWEESFKNYRARGVEAGIKSDLRNAAVAEEAFYVTNNRYTTRIGELKGYNRSSWVDLNVDYADGVRFILSARKTGQTFPYWSYDSRNGAITAQATSVGTTGRDQSPGDQKVRALVDHLRKTNAKLYCAYWAPHCGDQKRIFGASAERVPYIECSSGGPRSPQTAECQAAGIESYPTWVMNGQRYEGILTSGELAVRSGFKEGTEVEKKAVSSRPAVVLSHVRSLEGAIRTEMIFENRLSEPVLIFWVNYQGQEVLYRELNPQRRYSVQTFATHPWRVRIKGTNQAVKEIVAKPEKEIVIIK